MDSKPFWASKTIWANILSLIATIATVFGVDLGLTPEAQATIIAGVMGVVNIVLRLVTKTGVSAAGGSSLHASPIAAMAAFALTLLLLAGCAGDAGTRAAASLAVACDGYATALSELAVLREAGSLSRETVSAVDRANAIADPLCLPDSPVDPAASVAVVRDVAATLKGMLK